MQEVARRSEKTLNRAGCWLAGVAVAAIVSAGATAARAQTPAIVVMARDAASTAPLSGVRITLDHRPTGDTTDVDGVARLLETPAGAHVVGLRLFGYAPDSESVVVTPGKSVMVERQLRTVAKALPGITSTAEAVDPRLEGFMKRMATGAGYFFTRGKIDSSHTRTLDQLLRAGAPANLIQGPGGLTFLASHGAQLNGQPCWVQIFMDGVLIYNPSLDGSPMGQQDVTNLKGYLTSQLEAVEYYANPASTPVQFREGTPKCGTLVLWSRMH